jgi:tetratricopeptide (TPR) repeat protein
VANFAEPSARRPPRAAAQKPASEEAEPVPLAARFAQARQLCVARQFDRAERLCRQMLKTAPGHPQITLMLGEILSERGRHQEAIALLRPLIPASANPGPLHFGLGNALHAAGRLQDAAAHFRRAVALRPQLAGAWCNLGLVLDRLGDAQAAIGAYNRAILLQPNLAAARANLGTALLKADNHDDAALHLRQAVALSPRVASNHHFLGVALARGGAYAEAAQCQRAAIALKPDFAEAFSYLGEALARQHRVTEALAHYRRAVALRPDFVQGWVALGSALLSLGRFSEAIEAFERAIAINPNLGIAHRGLTTCRQQIDNAGELDRLHAIIADPATSTEDRGDAGLAIAKILDDSERYDEAFAAATEGNRLLRQAQFAADMRYDHAALRAENDAVQRLFTPEFFAATRDWGNPSELPVFIVGYFRTGTTLVEQICASHSRVYGAGELPDIWRIWAALRDRMPSPAKWTAAAIRGDADRHLEHLARLAPGARAQRITDKMPDNIYQLGLIAAMYPRARVIFCHRDGRDAALSVFFQSFNRKNAFSTDLLDAGRRWREAERMAAYWAGCLPLAMHHVQYEALVGDFANEAKKLIAFLGLDWEPACLEFYKTERAVRTVSTWQVRQPLYHSSVGRWRNYRNYLQQLCEVIGIDGDAETGARPRDLV